MPPIEADPMPAQSPLERSVRNALLGTGLLGLMAVGQHRMQESDVFWHLAQGRAVLRHMSRVVPEPTAFPELASHATVAAWLWDVIAYLTVQAASFGGLAWLTSACAVLAGIAVVWMLRVTRANAPAAATLVVAALGFASITSRARARPEIAALILLPCLVSTLLRFVQTQDRARIRYGALAFLCAVTWAQTHGSFLLVLPMGAAVLGPALLARRHDPRERSALLALGLALLLASLSSSSGAHIFSYGAEHASHDIKLHNMEMHPPQWGTFNPLSSVYGPLYACTLLLAAFGAARLRARALAELGLALVGLAILTQSVRFLAPATLLSAPLALHGASELVRDVRRRHAVWVLAAGAALALALFGRALVRVHAAIGPLLTTGLAEHALPLRSAKYLATLPEGSRAITAYDAGGLLGFLLDGRVRTFVDSRTMVLFDDVQFAIARDTFYDRTRFERVAQRYGATAVVLPRSSPLCAQLSSPWAAVVVEPEWTTFVKGERAAVDALRAVAPCGREYLQPEACEAGGSLLAADLKRLRALGDAPLYDFVEALGLVRCSQDLVAAERRLPSRASARGFEVERDLAAGVLALALHQGEGMLEALEPWAAQGDLAAWTLLQRAMPLGKLDAAALRSVAERAVERLDDQTPAHVREMLALSCIAQRDPACVRFHGLRAALAGSPNGPRILGWLASEHPDPGVRADAAGWLTSLAQDGTASAPR